jgi:hypothetical protein
MAISAATFKYCKGINQQQATKAPEPEQRTGRNLSALTWHVEHNLTIEVTTTLFNRINADADKILQVSTPVSLLDPAYSATEPQDYGLLGNVTAEWVF